MTEYPEHEKLDKVKDKSQAIGEFIEWMNTEKHLTICKYMKEYDGFSPIGTSIERLLAEFFGIDLDKLEMEKRAMLDEIRNLNKKKED